MVLSDLNKLVKSNGNLSKRLLEEKQGLSLERPSHPGSALISYSGIRG